MKKLFTLFVAAALVFAAIACNKGGESGATAAPDANEATQAPGGVIPPETDASNAALSGELMPGMFTVFNDVGGFKLNGVRFSAERTGNPSGINNWDASLTRVRTVFELDEWIAYTVDYEYGNEYAKLGVWLFPHRALSEYGNISDMEGDVFFCEYELPYETYPKPIDDMFDLQTKYNQSGDYDLFLTLNGQIIGGTLLRFVENGALEGMSDEQIASMMAVG